MSIELNDEQRAAVAALTGGVLISAGAGSGKTRTLTERLVHALGDQADESWEAAEVTEILAITFTEKAAGELSERVRRALRSAGKVAESRVVDASWISTIHGFCSRLLRRHALDAGLDPNFSVADTVVASQLKEQAFDRAAQDLIATPSGEALFSEYEFGAVFEAAESLASVLRSRGFGAEALRPEVAPTGRELLRRARELFAEASHAVAACGDTRAAASAFRESCSLRICALDEIDADGLPDADLAREVWEALEAWKPGRSASTFSQAHEHAKSEHQRLLAQSAAASAAEFSAGLCALAAAYHGHYQSLKRSRGILDFDDLQIEALALLEGDATLQSRWRSQFRLVMVDEFQDTDALQLDVVKAVAGANLCTVGDEHQSIYRFRGADVAVYRSHNVQMRLQGARDFALRTNYRSHAAIIEFVNAVFGTEAFFGGDLLRLEYGRSEAQPPALPDGEARIDLYVANRPEGGITGGRQAEASAVAEHFARLRDDHGANPGDMVVLLRTYSNAHLYADALQTQGFRTAIVGGSRFFDLPEVCALRALLRVVANPRDEAALAELMASDLGGLSDDALWLLRRECDRDGHASLWDGLREHSDTLSEVDEARAAQLARTIETSRGRVGEMPLSELLLRAVEELNFDLDLLASGPGGAEAFANVLKLARMADAFESASASGPAAFSAYLDAKQSYGDHTSPATLADEETQAVRLLSIHASKGLEFPHVAVVDLGSAGPSDRGFMRSRADGDHVEVAVRLPSEWCSKNGSGRSELFVQIDEDARAEDVAEAKRLLYVACTRAEETLALAGTLTSDKDPDSRAGVALDWLRVALRDPLPSVTDTTTVALGEHTLRVTVVDAPPTQVEARGEERANPADELRPPWPMLTSLEHGHAAAQDPPTQMSYSQFAAFERCSLRFWAECVLRVRRLAEPGDESATGFGSAVHALLEAADGSGTVPDERVAAIGRAFGLDEADLQRLAVAVSSFLTSGASRELAACESVDREARFAIQMPSTSGGYLLRGSIDAYGRSGDEALIVDYKTGSSGEPAELTDRYRLQASVYALVALRDGHRKARVAFVRPEVLIDGEPQRVDFEFDLGDLPEIETRLHAARERMERAEYRPLETWDHQLCPTCPIAEGICPLPRSGAGGRG